MTAVFGGLFGLATIASVFALLIQVFPVKDQRAAVEAAAALMSSAAEPKAEPAKKSKSRRRVRTPLPSPWRLAELKKDAKVRLVDGTMQRRSFIIALKEAGVPKPEVYRILKAFEEVKKFDRTGRKDEFKVALDRSTKKVVAFEYIVGPTEIYQARVKEDGLLRAERLDLKVRQEEFSTSFYIGPELKKSYYEAGLEHGIIKLMNQAFNGRTSTEAFEEGGIIRIKVVETTALGLFASYERIDVLEYRPPDPAKPPMRAYYFETTQTRGYVDERGRMLSAKGWRSPVPGAPITSPFNLKRLHPILKVVRPHNGIDYGASSGTPVYAANRGKISFAGQRGGFGNYVTIDHPQGIETGYAHLSRIAPGIKAGLKVGTLQLIGYVGSTGRSTGPHLHFGAKKNGQYFDPLDLKLDSLRLLPVAERATFLARKAKLDQLLDGIPMPEPPEPEPEPELAASAAPSASAPEPEPEPEPESSSKPKAKKEEADEDDESADEDEPSSGEGTDLLGPDLSGDIE